MASFSTGIHPSDVMDENEKSIFVVVKDRNDRVTPYHLSKSLTEWKPVAGDPEPVLFAQTWYAKRIGLAA